MRRLLRGESAAMITMRRRQALPHYWWGMKQGNPVTT